MDGKNSEFVAGTIRNIILWETKVLDPRQHFHFVTA